MSASDAVLIAAFILPCAVCGQSEPVVKLIAQNDGLSIFEQSLLRQYPERYAVVCDPSERSLRSSGGCGASVGCKPGLAGAVNAWNTQQSQAKKSTPTINNKKGLS